MPDSGIEIDLGINQRRGKFVNAVGWTPFGEFVGEILGVTGSQSYQIQTPR